MESFEKLGAFYLGRIAEEAGAAAQGGPLLYDSRDLTTHGLIVGMTGSGKTGLAVVLLEEAVLDQVPALVIDPKGDMANLALRFPRLAPEDFLPWMEAREAAARGIGLEELAAETAKTWEEGIREWGQSKERIQSLADAAEVSVYTPGSSSVRPLSLLRGFDAPPPAVLRDEDALRERVRNAASGLLGLVGIEADPFASREHALLSSLLDRSWRASESASLERLVSAVQSPPFEKLGALDLESFFPARDRTALASRLNNLLVSPAFAAWREGEPIDVQRLLYTKEGRPRVSVLSIAHLNDPERLFFVTIFLNEVLTWMRSQPGTGSLRALLYVDEIFGFFPPVQAPPSKAPMLTLLKQARAFGLGVVLATQNPVDLDYKGLANIGTWFLGRLQTERDRERLIEGLASASGGFDRERTEATLSSLGKRTFLMHNVHEDRPVLFRTRWALSYLRGPMTLQQLEKLKPVAMADPEQPEPKPATVVGGAGSRPPVPPSIEECFFGSEGEVYRPNVLAEAELHFVSAAEGIDVWETIRWLTPLDGEGREPDWSNGAPLAAAPVDSEPASGVRFAELPAAGTNAKTLETWKKSISDFLYRTRRLELFKSRELKLTSAPGESEADFRARLAHRMREKRDEEMEKLRKRYAPRVARLEEAVRRAEAKLERESSQYQGRKLDTFVDFGVTLAGALFGRKLGSATNITRASRTARSVSRASRERGDVSRAEEELAERKQKLAELEAELEGKIQELRGNTSGEALELQKVSLAPRKTEVLLQRYAIAWMR